MCAGNCSSSLRYNPNRETIEFSDWLHMECLQRPTVHPGWLSSFFKAIWSLLKLSLFKEPAERGESIWVLVGKEEIRFKVANRYRESRYCSLQVLWFLLAFLLLTQLPSLKVVLSPWTPPTLMQRKQHSVLPCLSKVWGFLIPCNSILSFKSTQQLFFF